MNEILILSRNGSEIRLFCNSYLAGNDYLYFCNDIEPEKIEAVLLEDAEITLKELELATYYFSTYEDMSSNVSIPVVSDEVERVEDCFREYLELADEEEKEEKACEIEKLISKQEFCINYYDDDFDIRLSKTNIIKLELVPDQRLNSGILTMEIEKFEPESGDWKIHQITDVHSTLVILPLEDSALYRVALFINDRLIRKYTLFTEANYSDKNFDAVLKNKKAAEQATENSPYFLPADYCFSSKKEKQIMLNLNYMDRLQTLMPRPRLGLEENIVRCQLGADTGLFKIKQIYLCGIEEDQIYSSGYSPRLIPVIADDMKFDIREYRFNCEPYYFYFADENGIRLSSVTYLDLTKDNQDKNDYNKIYQHIYEGNYVVRLNRTLEFFMPAVWPKIKQMLDSYLVQPDMEYMDITDYLISKSCTELSQKEFNKLFVVFYLEFCRQKYYLDKDAKFKLRQRFELLTKTHFIEKGNYVCKIMQISPAGDISYSYYDGREAGVYFRTDKAQYTLFRCISLDNYKVNDYNLYYLDSEGSVQYRFVDENIEVNNGR